jgi:hypothetical protein
MNVTALLLSRVLFATAIECSSTASETRDEPLFRADPIDGTAGELQPGMTIWLQIPARVDRQ